MSYQIRTNKTWDETIRDLGDTMDKWQVRRWTVTPTRPGRAMNRGPVTIAFTTRTGEEKSVTLGRQDTLRLNLRALYLSLEDMRMVEVRGLSDVYKAVYGSAIVAAGTTSVVGPYAVLGVVPDAPWEVIEAAYRTLARKRHPDMPNGSTAAMQALNSAYAAVKRERGR